VYFRDELYTPWNVLLHACTAVCYQSCARTNFVCAEKGRVAGVHVLSEFGVMH